LTVSAFAQKKDTFLDFVYNVAVDKDNITRENFNKQGFIGGNHNGSYEEYKTVWNNEVVIISIDVIDKTANFLFSQNDELSVNVDTGKSNADKMKEPDLKAYMSDWQTFINYFTKRSKLINSKNNTYQFFRFKIVNAPDTYCFYIANTTE
jgi:hypothetical protein